MHGGASEYSDCGLSIFIFVMSVCFTSEPVSAERMRDKLTEIKTLLGYGGSEVFPKQIQLKSQDDTGNFLNLPYFNGDDTTRYAFKQDGSAATLEEFYTIYTEVKRKT